MALFKALKGILKNLLDDWKYTNESDKKIKIPSIQIIIRNIG